MKYLEKTFASVPEHITNHLDVQLLAILTDAIGKAIKQTLKTVSTEYLPPTMASVLEGSLADFWSRFDSTVGADSTLQVREFLEDAMDSRIQDHIAVMTAIEGIGTRLSALDHMIATSDASAACPSPDDVPPRCPRLRVWPLAQRALLTCPFRRHRGMVFNLLHPLLLQPHLPAVSELIRPLQMSWEAGSRLLAPLIRLGVRGT